MLNVKVIFCLFKGLYVYTTIFAGSVDTMDVTVYEYIISLYLISNVLVLDKNYR